jgi:very-short-patch-repair endonuclease
MTNVRQLLDVLDRHPRRRGARNLARIVATGPAPTRSELEDVVLDLILGGGFEHPQVNVPVTIEDRRVVPDFRWPDQHLTVEADGAAFHDNPIVRAEDADRQALLEADGERVLRITWTQATTRRAQTRKRLEAAGAPRHPP